MDATNGQHPHEAGRLAQDGCDIQTGDPYGSPYQAGSPYPQVPQGYPTPQPPQQAPSGSIALCQDGKYRWAYELGLFSNPTVLFLIWKIFAGIGVGLWLLMIVLACADNDWDIPGTIGDMTGELPFVLIGFLAMFAITGLGYAVYALINGGKYCVAFEMDDTGVTHRQMPSQVRKAEVVGMINVLAGMATGNMTQAGIGLVSAQSEMRSDFASVRSIRGIRSRSVIKLNEPLAKNQVYMEPADYDFVMGYISSRCPQAQVSGK